MATRLDPRADPSGEAALLAFAAAQVAGEWSDPQLAKFAERAGLRVSGRSMRNVPKRNDTLKVKGKSPFRMLFPRTVTFSPQDLGFYEAVVRLDPGDRRSELEPDIRSILGVLEVVRSDGDGELLVFVTFKALEDKLRIEASLGELGKIIEWVSIAERWRDSATETWIGYAMATLAQAIAEK